MVYPEIADFLLDLSQALNFLDLQRVDSLITGNRSLIRLGKDWGEGETPYTPKIHFQ